MNKNPKYIVLAALTSFVLPIATVVWFITTYSFRNPDGSIDNGPIRGMPFVAIFFVFVFVFQLFAYSALGRWFYKSPKPRLVHCVVYATSLSLPLPIFVLYTAYLGMQPWADAVLPVLAAFTYPWVCFMSGAVLQFWLINRRHNQAFKRTI